MSRQASRSPLVLIVAALVGVVVVPLVLLGPDSKRPDSAAPTDAVRAVAGEIRTVPQLAPDRKNELIRGLASALEELYGRAFLDSSAAPTAAPSPEPTPATRVDDLFTQRARAALRSDPDIFRPGPSVRATGGQVSFNGIVTLENAQPLQAFLQVSFEGKGVPVGRTTPEIRLQQTGTLLLGATPGGWRVAGFGLHFETLPATPSPSP